MWLTFDKAQFYYRVTYYLKVSDGHFSNTNTHTHTHWPELSVLAKIAG